MAFQNLTFRLMRRYPLRIVWNVLLSFSGALFNGVSTTLLVPILLSLLGQDAIFRDGPPVIRYLLSPFNRLPEAYQLPAMTLVVLLAILLKNIAAYASGVAASTLNRALTADLQEEGLGVLLNVDLHYFNNAKAGDLMNRLGGEISRASSTISSVISLISTVITIFVFLVILLLISWQLTLVATLLLPFSTLILQHFVNQSKKFGRQITEISQQYSGGLIEVFSGIRLVKATASEEKEFNRFQKLIRQREQIDFRARLISAAISPIGETTNILALLILVAVGRMLFANQLETLSTVLLTYLVVLFRMLPYVSQLNGSRASVARSAASIEIVEDLLRRDNKSFMPAGHRNYDGLKEGIAFEDLVFHYPESSNLVLRGVSLKIPKGTTLALVGASGAGKSTLADLLPRFYDPTGGRITIDGTDLREFDLRSLRTAMGIVSQETFLFNDSVRYNIAYGCGSVTEDDILDAIKRANAYEFISRLPDGLDTMIGDRGVMLSGGQRQRLAIARALLRNPEILILDEATSALDTVSEQLVQQALDELSRERTTLVIAHRLSTVHKADQIAVLDQGQVVELGNHEELLEQNGHYSRLYQMQFTETSRQILSNLESKSQFFSQASYEFRARLNAMLGSLSLLADGLIDTPEERNELALQAYRSSLELFKTVRQLEHLTNSASVQGAGNQTFPYQVDSQEVVQPLSSNSETGN